MPPANEPDPTHGPSPGTDPQHPHEEALQRAHDYRLRRLHDIDQTWGLHRHATPPAPTWAPWARHQGEYLVPGFITPGPTTRPVERICRNLEALGVDPESALFWLTAPNVHLDGSPPITAVESRYGAVRNAAEDRFARQP